MKLKRSDPIVLPVLIVTIISLVIPAVVLLADPQQLKALIFFLGTFFAIVTGGLLYAFLRQREQFANSQKRFEDITCASPNIICELDTKFKIRYANPVALKVFGISKEKMEYGVDIPQFFSKNERFAARKLLAKLLSAQEPQTAMFEMQKADGSVFSCEMTLAPSFDVFHKRIGFRVIMRDVTALANAQQHIEYLALFDKLTGLPNQLLFEDRLSQAIARAKRTQETVGLFLAELTHFKLIAESQGHATADLILAVIAKRLGEQFRQEDTLAITDHHEFALIVCQPTTPHKIQSLLTVAKKMLDNLQKPFTVEGKELFLGTSIGVALFPDDSENVPELIKKASAAKYHARAQGKNNYQFYQPALTKIAEQQQETEKRHRFNARQSQKPTNK